MAALPGGAAALLPLLLLGKGRGGLGHNTGRPFGALSTLTGRLAGMRPDSMLQDLAPYMPATAQPQMLRTASIMQAARQLQTVSHTVPQPRQPSGNMLDFMETMMGYLTPDSEGSPLTIIRQGLQQARTMRSQFSGIQTMLKSMRGMMQAPTAATASAPAHSTGNVALPALLRPSGSASTSNPAAALTSMLQNNGTAAQNPQDLIQNFQSALSKMNPDTVQRLMQMAQSFSQNRS